TFLEQTEARFVKGYGALNPARITSTSVKSKSTTPVLIFEDLGGQEDWVNYDDEANALIFVVDATRRDLSDEVAMVFKYDMSNEYMRMMPVLVAVNKSEIESAAPGCRDGFILSTFSKVPINLFACFAAM
ncbi:unnamed protein product, partial [Haemonchus placei]|uniref:GTP-binding protein Rheb n=1 Tax=Haemonchus placei TaxID=6290 RepID=A0A0N4WQ12_HAEPC